jgi:hypothetical protein
MRARRSHRPVLLLLAFLGVIAAAPSTASATGTLDQQFIPGPPATNAPIGGSAWKAQSFEAGATGALDQVDLLLWKEPTTTAPLTVEIRTLSGGVPSQTVLASASVLAADVPTGIGAQNWVSVPLTPPAPSVAGTQYAIVLSAPSAASFAYEWVVSSGAAATYADGSFLRSFNSGASWTADAFDNGFKTYVTAALPTSKAQCKKGGWRDFEVFKNQGDCVSFVATKGKNPPSGSPSASTKGHRSRPR